MSIGIVTDSTCDLPAEIITEYGITVIPLYINIGDRGYLDGVEITRQEFYEGLADYDPLPTTATPGPIHKRVRTCIAVSSGTHQCTIRSTGPVLSGNTFIP
ncbi:DegV family protein [Chloroflexota bacterium]